jgi:cyanophycin synthetase
MHLKPADGKPRPVGEAIVDNLFARKKTAASHRRRHRHPRQTTIARLVARMLHLSGKHVGLACSDGCSSANAGSSVATAPTGTPPPPADEPRGGGRRVRERPRSILAEGLAYDRCLVGVVTNIDPDDSLPEFTSRTPTRSPQGLRTQVDVVLPMARPCSMPTTRRWPTWPSCATAR